MKRNSIADSEVFPEPLAPTTATVRPGMSSRSTPVTAAGADECVFGQRPPARCNEIGQMIVGGLGHWDGRLHQLEHALTTLSGAAVRERRARKDLHGLESRKRNQHNDRKHHSAHRAITNRRRAKG